MPFNYDRLLYNPLEDKYAPCGSNMSTFWTKDSLGIQAQIQDHNQAFN